MIDAVFCAVHKLIATSELGILRLSQLTGQNIYQTHPDRKFRSPNELMLPSLGDGNLHRSARPSAHGIEDDSGLVVDRVVGIIGKNGSKPGLAAHVACGSVKPSFGRLALPRGEAFSIDASLIKADASPAAMHIALRSQYPARGVALSEAFVARAAEYKVIGILLQNQR
jgi:hypothetical protein